MTKHDYSICSDLYVDGSVAPMKKVYIRFLDYHENNSGNPPMTSGPAMLRNGKIGFCVLSMGASVHGTLSRYFISEKNIIPTQHYPDAGEGSFLLEVIEEAKATLAMSA